MKPMTKPLVTRIELAMMGKVQPCTNDEVVKIADAVGRATDTTPNKELINRLLKNHKVVFFDCYRLFKMPCLALILDDPDRDYPAPFTEDYGTGCPAAFSYVLNLSDDFCSEFGDVFFKLNSDGYYHIAN